MVKFIKIIEKIIEKKKSPDIFYDKYKKSNINIFTRNLNYEKISRKFFIGKLYENTFFWIKSEAAVLVTSQPIRALAFTCKFILAVISLKLFGFKFTTLVSNIPGISLSTNLLYKFYYLFYKILFIGKTFIYLFII